MATIIVATSVFAQNETNNDGNLRNIIPKWLTDENPLKQYKLGVSSNIVVCKEDLHLIIRAEDKSPACVKDETYKILVERRWAENPTSTFGAYLEQNHNYTEYKNLTMTDTYTIDVKVDPNKETYAVLYFQIFFSNGTLYKSDTVPITDIQPDGYYKYHVNIKSSDYTKQEDLKAIITYNNATTTVYIPSINESYDVFGVKEIYPTKKDGSQWYMNTNDILNDVLFFIGPPGTSNCTTPSTCTLVYKNLTENTWHAKRIDVPVNEGIRMIVKSPIDKLWLNTEMTGYYKLKNSTHYPQEFIHVTRSGSPHSSLCHGYSYYSGITYDGNIAEIQKSLFLAGDPLSYSETFTASGITTPLTDRWFGMKTMTYNINNNTAVKLEVWIDDQVNNNWREVFERVDTGWSVPGDPSSFGCINPPTGLPMKNTDKILWGGTEQEFRADNAEIDFEKLSIREITPPLP